MPKTKYSEPIEKINRVGITPPQYIHEIDQFIWYRDIVSRTIDEELGREAEYSEGARKKLNNKLTSGVRFHLPYSPGTTAPTFLAVVGNGIDLDVYFARIAEFTDTVSFNNYPKIDSRLWKVFGRAGYKTDLNKSEEKVELSQIPFTDIKPFLKGGDYEREADRIYVFGAMCGDEYLKVVAQNKSEHDAQRLLINYKLSNSDEENILMLVPTEGIGWHSEKLDKKKSTQRFSFSNVINA